MKIRKGKKNRSGIKMNLNRVLLLILISISLTIAQNENENKTKLESNINKTNGVTAVADKIEFKNYKGNSILTITDEGGDAASITIPQSTPSTIINKLYNEGGTLKFNGSAIGANGGADSINHLADAKYDGSSLYLGEEAGVNDNGNSNFNVGVGYNSLFSNTKGEKNTSIGYMALLFNTSGSYNSANGYQALYSNISGTYNTANGSGTLYSNTSGGHNTAFGYKALNSNTVGHNNTGIGRTALMYNTTGGSNTSLGASALGNNTTGNNNVGVGYFANHGNQHGANNTMIGYRAGGTSSIHNKSGNIFLGYMAGYHEMDDNKLYINNDSSASPLIWGDFELDSLLINGNLHVTGNISSDGNNIGATKIDDLSDGIYDGNSLFLGVGAGSSNIGIYNTALGTLALSSNLYGELNSAIGTQALSSNTNGNRNTANGYQALSANITGSGNTANGYQALSSNSIGNYNVGIGTSSNTLNQEGSKNTIIGYEAGRGTTIHNKSGSVFLGYQAGYEEETDNKLYIENSSSTNPLIYGDFTTDSVKINGDLEVKETTQICTGGVPINEIKLLTGSLSTTSYVTVIPYPSGYDQDNIYLLSCKVGPPSGSGAIWDNVGKYSTGDNRSLNVSFSAANIELKRTDSSTSNRDYKMVLMKIE